MTFSVARWSVLTGGMTGVGPLGVYDGTGTGAEGGDPLNTIKGDGFLSADTIKDDVRRASDTRSGPSAGMSVLFRGNNGTDIDTVWDDSGTLKTRQGAYSLKI